MAFLYTVHRYDEAIPLYRRALDIQEDALGPVHADVAVTTNDLAVLYYTQGNNEQAEKLYKKALSIYEQVFGPHHPDVGQVSLDEPVWCVRLTLLLQAVSNLGEFYAAHGNRSDAQQCLDRALTIYSSIFGPDHARTRAAQQALSRLA